jgi:hypothetical protein
MKNEIKEIKNLIIQHFQKDSKIEPIFGNENNNKKNQTSIIYKKSNFPKINNIPNKKVLNDNNPLLCNNINIGKNITLSMNDKDILVNINNSTNFKEFKTIVIQSFKLNNKDKFDIF